MVTTVPEDTDQPLILEVYHEKLEYTLIKHVHMITPVQLVSDFGKILFALKCCSFKTEEILWFELSD